MTASTTAPPANRPPWATLIGSAVLGTGLLRSALTVRPGSRWFYGLSLSAAAAWIGGGIAAGGLRPSAGGESPARPGPQVTIRSVAGPVAAGAAAFGVFYGAARIARHVPLLNRALVGVLRHSHRGADPLVLLTTLVNGVGEEVFFRGAVYAAAGQRRPAEISTVAYVVATAGTGNPALVLASAAMGCLFTEERRSTGGISAPLLTHLTWSTLMLRYVPPLFEERSSPLALVVPRR